MNEFFLKKDTLCVLILVLWRVLFFSSPSPPPFLENFCTQTVFRKRKYSFDLSSTFGSRFFLSFFFSEGEAEER